MASIIEASSISDLTQIASNPPHYPRNPTEKKREPLTLYISRVPGSRDVILTTLRPQLKNVTVEDVANSIYYLHLDSEEDALLQEPDQQHEPDNGLDVVPEDALPSPQYTPLSRKPLPEGSRLSFEDTARPSTSASEDRTVESATEPTEQGIQLPRKPLGPRPLGGPRIGRKPLPGEESEPLGFKLQQHSLPSPNVLRAADALNSGLSFQKSLEAENSPVSFSITLIRRDPSSGNQWNVGTIIGRTASQVSRVKGYRSASPTKKSPYEISINITTPGYTHFRSVQQSNQRGGLENGIHMTGPKQHMNASLGFHRDVRMEGSSFWDRTAKPHQRPSLINSPSAGSLAHERGHSSSFNHFQDEQADSRVEVDQNDTPKGYMFTSPWGGRCKFLSGTTGRNLRCKHTLPSISAGNTSLNAVPVSDLRFNLPKSAPIQAMVGAKDFKMPKIGHIRNKLSGHKTVFHPQLPPRPNTKSTQPTYAELYPSEDEGEEVPPPLPPRSSLTQERITEANEEAPPLPRRPIPAMNTSSDEDEDAPLDLSLGQEKAGGGTRGRRVKLGKLIIEDEGFKMLDLIVAANMGIWWSVWELSDRH